MKRKELIFLTQTGVIVALYTVLTVALAPISFGALQVRVAEALCVLPFFTPAALPGLFLGCVLSNVMGTPMGLLDIILGSLATLIAAAVAQKIRRRWLVPLPAVIINAFVVAFVLYYMAGAPYWLSVATVGAGQAIACYGIGMPLLFLLEKHRKVLFRNG